MEKQIGVHRQSDRQMDGQPDRQIHTDRWSYTECLGTSKFLVLKSHVLPV